MSFYSARFTYVYLFDTYNFYRLGELWTVKLLKNNHLKIHSIIDGNLELVGTLYFDHVVCEPEQLTRSIHNCIVIVCSISHKNEIISRIHSLIGKKADIITLDQFLFDTTKGR